MARKPRVKARSGVYHVVMQGVRHRDIFMDDEDYRRFVEILEHLMVKRTKEDEEAERYFTLYAYCLMPDHFHLLVKEEADSVSVTMGRIASAYAHYFNEKYDRDGAIYRARFASEPVEDEGRMDIVIRFISQSPERVMKRDASEYCFSSWHEYVGEESELPRVCEIKEVYRQMAKEDLVKALGTPVPKGVHCLGPRRVVKRPTDEQVLLMLCQMREVAGMSEFLGLPRVVQLRTLADLRRKGASVRQLERVTGIGRGVIQYL